MKLVEEVVRVGAWAEVKLLPGMEAEARRALTLRPKEAPVAIAQYRNHPEKPQHLFIPRSLVSKSGLPVDGSWASFDLGSKISLRDGQGETVSTFMQALADHSPYGGIIQAVTGAGKTLMAIEIAARLGLRTLIIVPRTSLVAQWFERITQFTSLRPTDIGIIQGGSCEYSKPVSIAMIHSLAQKIEQYPKDMYASFGTVIYDETHVVGAETFSQVAPLFRCKYRIGLSATPRRSDGMDNVFYWHIGPIVSKFTKLQAAARIRIIPYTGKDTSHHGCVWAGKLNLGRYFNRVAASEKRLDLLTRTVKALDEKDHDILVLSDRINHLQQLRAQLIGRGVDESKLGMLIGSQKQLDKKIILGTYGSAGMGVDIPRLSALVLATPRADIEQAVGRVLRQGSPVVVDIVDLSSSIMRGWSRARMKFYQKISDNIQDRTGL